MGAGLIGPRHALHVSNNPQTDLFAIIDPNPPLPMLRKLSTRYISHQLNHV